MVRVCGRPGQGQTEFKAKARQWQGKMRAKHHAEVPDADEAKGEGKKGSSFLGQALANPEQSRSDDTRMQHHALMREFSPFLFRSLALGNHRQTPSIMPLRWTLVEVTILDD